MVFVFRSMFLVNRFISSIGLSPVSLLSISFILSGLPEYDMNVLIWSVEGIRMVFCSGEYLGISHSIL